MESMSTASNPGSDAEQQGLMEGDQILKINNQSNQRSHQGGGDAHALQSARTGDINSAVQARSLRRHR